MTVIANRPAEPPPGPAEADEDDYLPVHDPTLRGRDAEFVAFMLVAEPVLARMAWLLTGDVHRAQELVQQALVRTYVAWPRAREGEPLAYARRVLSNARIDTWRRRRREVLVAPDDVPDRAPGAPDAHAGGSSASRPKGSGRRRRARTGSFPPMPTPPGPAS